jgi:hypothetical protein
MAAAICSIRAVVPAVVGPGRPAWGPGVAGASAAVAGAWAVAGGGTDSGAVGRTAAKPAAEAERAAVRRGTGAAVVSASSAWGWAAGYRGVPSAAALGDGTGAVPTDAAGWPRASDFGEFAARATLVAEGAKPTDVFETSTPATSPDGGLTAGWAGDGVSRAAPGGGAAGPGVSETAAPLAIGPIVRAAPQAGPVANGTAARGEAARATTGGATVRGAAAAPGGVAAPTSGAGTAATADEAGANVGTKAGGAGSLGWNAVSAAPDRGGALKPGPFGAGAVAGAAAWPAPSTPED